MSFEKDYRLDKLLRVVEAHQRMLVILADHELSESDKLIDLCGQITPAVSNLTKVMAETAGVKWQQSDARSVLGQGREGLETLATRYGCASLLWQKKLAPGHEA